MKHILAPILLAITFSMMFSSISFADCSNCASEAYDGYRDAKKAYRSGDLSGCQRYAKKAYRHLSYAADEANNCGCSDAESEAYSGYRDAKKAYRSGDLSGCQRYAKKAYRHASYAEDAANSCN